MAFYETIPAPPVPREGIEWGVGVLNADTKLSQPTWLGGFGRVFRHRQPVDLPDRLIVVRELVPAGGRVSTLSRINDVPMQVMVECDKETRNLDKWHDAIHGRIFELWEGAIPLLDSGAAALPVRRITEPGRSLYASETDTYYSSATYRLSLQPLMN